MNMNDRFFYHIYPLGMCGAPKRNDFSCPAGSGIRSLIDRVPHLVSLGVTGLYVGPLFESTAHGYDTVDYYHVDRRLGSNEDLVALVEACHAAGMAVVLDAVLNHTGRDFFAFRDLRERGQSSPYRDWYRGVDFSKRSPAGDSFAYEGWSGNYDLAKLNTSNGEVRRHLLGAVEFWIRAFGIDGLRLDAADVLAPDFMEELSSFAKSIKPDFWLMGEVVHGDYRRWAHTGSLDSVTNYELYKGLWSSFNDKNFFELAWSLNRQNGPEGMYRDIRLYTFVDNHDVNRVASVIKEQSHLFPVYGLLFTVPGIPSLYYGSEWGLRGERGKGTDEDLRPPVKETAEHGRHSGVPRQCVPTVDSKALEDAIRSFASVRAGHRALRDGGYRQLHVAHEQFAFMRECAEEKAIIAVNSSAHPAEFSLRANGMPRGIWKDALDPSFTASSSSDAIRFSVPSSWIRILTIT